MVRPLERAASEVAVADGGGPAVPVEPGNWSILPLSYAICSGLGAWFWSAVAACDGAKRKGLAALVPLKAAPLPLGPLGFVREQIQRVLRREKEVGIQRGHQIIRRRAKGTPEGSLAG